MHPRIPGLRVGTRSQRILMGVRALPADVFFNIPMFLFAAGASFSQCKEWPDGRHDRKPRAVSGLKKRAASCSWRVHHVHATST